MLAEYFYFPFQVRNRQFTFVAFLKAFRAEIYYRRRILLHRSKHNIFFHKNQIQRHLSFKILLVICYEIRHGCVSQIPVQTFGFPCFQLARRDNYITASVVCAVKDVIYDELKRTCGIRFSKAPACRMPAYMYPIIWIVCCGITGNTL